MKYDNKAIAEEIRKTAAGTAYYGNSLLVALDIPCIANSKDHKRVVQAYLNGSFVRIPCSHVTLQEAAFMIEQSPDDPNAHKRFDGQSGSSDDI